LLGVGSGFNGLYVWVFKKMDQQKMGQDCYRDVFKICYRCIYSVVDFISAMYNKSKLISRIRGDSLID